MSVFRREAIHAIYGAVLRLVIDTSDVYFFTIHDTDLYTLYCDIIKLDLL